jgi:hypothetical protein
MHYAITKKKWFRVMLCGFQSGARTFKCLWGPGFDSKE